MTVGEIIEKLNEYPVDMEVVGYNEGGLYSFDEEMFTTILDKYEEVFAKHITLLLIGA